jgi:hypothetical protein
MAKRKSLKKPSRKSDLTQVYSDNNWTVSHGRLIPGSGRPREISRLFRVVGEKLPVEALHYVRKDMLGRGLGSQGVYVAHDSMGYARYVGRGRIFSRLKSRVKSNTLEVRYFSFYVVQDKQHEREIETALIRVSGPLLYFNERKKRLSLSAGNVTDYEPATEFFLRQYKKGRRAKKK